MPGDRPTPAGLSSPRTLLFDIGGVVIENVMFDELQRLTQRESQADLKAQWLRSPHARDFELGELNADEFANGIISEFHLDMAPAAFLAAFARWPRDYFPGALDLIARLRRTHRVCALTNCNAIHWSERLQTPFEQTFSSHLMGAIKPDPVVFEQVAEALQTELSEILFFDDSLPNVAAAARLGVQAYHTDGFAALQETVARLYLT